MRRREDGGVEWRCVVCATWNPLSLDPGAVEVCSVCQTPLRESITRAAERSATPRASEGTALVAAAVLPGLGHVLLGSAASGAARMFLYVIWLAGSLVLLAGAAGSGQSVLPAGVLLVGAVLVWAGTLVDTLRLSRGAGSELLEPRVLLWIVVGVLGALVVTLTTSAIRLPGAG